MDALTKIESDHQEIRRLIDEVDQALETPLSNNKAYQKLKSTVLRHHHLEQNILFAELVQHETSHDKAMHLIEEHGEHKKVIEQMRDLDSRKEDWIEHYKELRHDLLHHLEEEEQDLFKLIRDALDGDQLNEIGNKMVIASAEVNVQ